MRFSTRLRIMSSVTITALVVLAPVLVWSLVEFRGAKNDYDLADAIKVNFFERAAFRDQYFLYREDRARAQWVNSSETAKRLLRQAEIQFHDEEDRQVLEHLRGNIQDSAAIFQRIVDNTRVLNSAAGNRHVYEELDKRLFSQLLVKAAATRDTASALQNASAQRVEQTYQRLSIIIGLFAATLALATILTSMHLGRLIRKRLAPLHDGAKIIASGDLDYRIPCNGTDEFAELARSINAMTDKLQAFTQQLEAEISAHKQSEEMLRKLSTAVEQSPASVVITDLEGGIQYVNPRFTEVTGYTAAEAAGQNPRILQSGQTPKEIYLELWDRLARGMAWHGELLNKRKNGELYWEETHIAPVKNAAGTVSHYVAVKTDITERKQIDKMLQESEARLRAILDNSPYLIWLKDMDGRFAAVNKAFFNTTGRGRMDEVLGKTDFDIWPEELAKKYRADDADVISTRKQKLTEEMSLDNGEVRWVETFKAPIMDVDGNLLGTTGFAQDITGRKNAEVQIRHLAHYDPLTDLPNRTLFSDRLQQALATAKRDKTRLALMFLDLDKFKPVNDALGHHVGDLLLKEVAKRMQDCVRESDTVARIGGDEFVVLLPSIETEQDAVLVAEKIRLALNRPFALVGQSLNISSSTGIAVYPEHGNDETKLVKNADAAMYRAKEGGRDCVKLYHPGMDL